MLVVYKMSGVLLHAVRFAEDHGMGRVVFETDCLALVQAINSGTLDRSSLGAIFRELKYQLQFGFIKWNVYHCPRTCNAPAHVLAALGCSGAYGNEFVWLSNRPDDVTCAVTTDLVGPW